MKETLMKCIPNIDSIPLPEVTKHGSLQYQVSNG